MAAPAPSRSFAFANDASPRLAPSAAPLDLTASDGTGLRLVELSARIVLQGPLAFTELRLVFQNPEDRQLEGRFRVTLPSGAAVSRFAMKQGSRWQEGEVIERQQARRVYEDLLHQRQDPALLEHEAGNEFSARVFPIEARAQKELIVSYSHELPHPEDPYTLPLRGLPRLGRLDLRALVGQPRAAAAATSLGGEVVQQQVVEVRRDDWEPDQDFVLAPPPAPVAGLRHGSLALFRVAPTWTTEPDEIASLLVLLDTSASRSLVHARQVALVDGLLRALAAGAGPATPVAVACFDQEVDLIFDAPVSTFEEAAALRLRARPALGASDLGAALRWAAEHGPRHQRVLLITDGVNTAGDDAPGALIEAARALRSRGFERLDVITLGGLRDDATLRALVTAGLPRDGTVSDGDLAPAALASRLTRATRSGLTVRVPGASWVWPARLDGVQPGDVRLVYAELPAQQPAQLQVEGADLPTTSTALAEVERPLLERAWIKARIERLEHLRASPDTEPDVRSALVHQIVELSTRHRVLSAHTALLVLDTDEDYSRYHLDRRALADILTVGLSGLEVLARSSAAPPPPPPTPKIAAARSAVRSVAKRERSSLDQGAVLDQEPQASEGGLEFGEVEDAPAAPRMDAMPAAELEEDDDEMPTRVASSSDQGVELSLRSLGGAAEERPAPPAAPAAAAPPPPPPPAFGAPAPMREARAVAPPSPAPAARPVPAPSAPAPEPMPQAAPVPAAPPRPVAGQARSDRREDPSREAPELEAEAGSGASALAPPPPDPRLSSWTGAFREVMELLLTGRAAEALRVAQAWREREPGDVLALVALGEAAEAVGNTALAARAYGSLIDLFPGRADLRRYAGERLSRLGTREALALAIDTFRRAVASRPDHPSGHRLLGMALLRAGRMAEGFEAIAFGQARSYPPRFPGVDRILREDLGLAAAACIRQEPGRRAELQARLHQAGAALEQTPSVRFVLVWETDGNDVDFHIHDPHGGHAYYGQRVLSSGGELYADVTQGYGPECFTVRGAPEARAYPYRLQAHYFRRGPMGYGMGALQLIEHDGQGGLRFEERPYVIMTDGAYVDLGEVHGPLTA